MALHILSDITTRSPECPFCRHQDDLLAETPCEHMIGWTNNGRTIEPRVPRSQLLLLGGVNVLATDVALNTGVSTRVYRKGDV